MGHRVVRVGLGILLAWAIIPPCEAAPPQTILSHPPIRKIPDPGQRPLPQGPLFYVDSSRGRDADDGSLERPWKTVNHALRQARPGDTVLLREGTYFENVYCAVAGTPEAPITLRSAPGERAIIDGGQPEFELDPATAWEPAAGGVPDEFVSTRTYRNIRDVVGLFGDSNIGLQTYWYAEDLRAENEFWIPDEKTMVKPVYCGPGLWYDKQTGRIHVRLAHTRLAPSADHNYPDVNYAGETDPRKLPLVIAAFHSVPLHLDQAMHVRFEDLVIRGAGYRTVRLDMAIDIAFDHCTIFCGTYGLWTKGTGPLKITDCGVHGMIPPWATRDENCLYVYKPNVYPPFIPDEKPGRNIARLPTHALLVPEGGCEFEVFYYPYDHDWEISHCEFSDSHDGIYLAGYDIRFHHNWVDSLQDDCIYVSSSTPYRNHSVRIHQNYLSSGITAFGQHGRGGPGGNVFIYRNVVDLRKPMPYNRSADGNPAKTFKHGHSMLFMHASDSRLSEEAIHFYHNTCLLQAIGYAAAMHEFLLPAAPRRVFNNLVLYQPGSFRNRPPQPVDQCDLLMDGNLHWVTSGDQSVLQTAHERIRKLAVSDATRKAGMESLEAHALLADPKCLSVNWDAKAANDYRLGKESPAIGAGVPLPRELEDPLRPSAGAPDIGALPSGSEPLRVGIRGRILTGIPFVPD